MSHALQENSEIRKAGATFAASGEFQFALKLSVAFSAVCGMTVAMHEMWRDELQAWMISRDSAGLFEMLRALKLEGHPPLWYLLLYPLTRITHDPRSMQIANWVIATCTVFLFAYRAPFSRLQRFLFAFGYYPLYEYGVISRDYGLALLALVVCCIGHSIFERTGKTLLLTISLAMMALLTIYTLIFAVCLVITIGFRCIFDLEINRLWNQNRFRWLISAGFIIVICGFSAILMQPPAGSGFAVGWHTEVSGVMFAKVLGTVWKAYFPIPRPTYDFWNSNILQNHMAPLQPLLGFGLLTSAVIAFRRHWSTCLYFTLGTSLILAFEYLKYLGYSRHYGWLLMLLVMSLWIAWETQKNGANYNGILPSWIGSAFTILLAANCLIAVFAAGMDLFYPFSSSRELATYLNAENLTKLPIVGHWDYAVSPLSAWLDKPIYFADSQRFGTFIHWDGSRSIVTNQQAEELATQLANQSNEDVLLVLTPDPNESVISFNESHDTKLLKTFVDAMVPSERYWLYRVAPHRPDNVLTVVSR